MPERARTSAFGLELDAWTPLIGLAEATPTGVRGCRLDPASEQELDERWPSEHERMHDVVEADGSVSATLDATPAHGYRFASDRYGGFLVAPDGTSVLCAVDGLAPWEWQLYLTAHVLPFAATLQGIEVLHASAVALEGRALAILGDSHAGKTTLAVTLATMPGGRLVADDALAVEPRETDVLAHPGPGVVNLRDPTVELLGGTVGNVVGRKADGVRVEVARAEAAVPLRALYFLHRGGVEEVAFEAIDPVDPRLLLLSTFVIALRTPERMISQLDACQRLAQSTAAFTLQVPDALSVHDLGRAVEAHALALA